MDVLNARLAQLADETLDEDLAPHAKERLGALEGQRGEAPADARGEDDGATHAERLERLASGVGDGKVARDEAGFRQRANGLVDRAERDAGVGNDVSLRGRGLGGQRGENAELDVRNH